jgi:hypothetical protein
VSDGQSCTVRDNGDGTKTISCADGTSVTVSNGQAGASCTVTDNGNGTKTISCADGTSVTVSDGQAGGSCTVTDDGHGTKTISCTDGTSVTVRDGVTVATVTVHVVDADSRADVAGATVVANPGATGTTDASGRVTLANLPAGVYQFSVSAPGLKLSGSSVVAGTTKIASIDSIAIIAGATLPLEIELSRIDRDALNLVTLHTSGNASYAEANCRACHNDRKGELSADPTVKPYHAMPTHSSLGCTFCHQTVDLVNHSGANIRKQVSVTTTCKGCHASYPASF